MAFQIESTAKEVGLPPTLTVGEAVGLLVEAGMDISAEALRCGIQQKVFPFGDCVETEQGPVFFLYRVQLDRWIYATFGRA